MILNQITFNEYSFVNPQQGNGLLAPVALWLGIDDSVGFHRREYFQVELREDIEPNKEYFLSYYVGKAFEVDVHMSNFGVHFTNELAPEPEIIYPTYPLVIKPHLVFDSIVRVSFGQWYKISHCFQLDPAYDIMTVGIFGLSDTIPFETVTTNPPSSFVAYDNFFLAEIEEEVELEIVENRDTICVGDCITLSSNHSMIDGMFDWDLPGGSPSSSTDSIVRVCYNTPGVYDVYLDVTHCTRTYSGEFI